MPPSPFVPFIISSLPALFGPPLLVYATYKSLTHFIHFPIPQTLFIPLLVASAPVWTYIKTSYNVVKNERGAAAIGAQLPPLAKGKWPGNLDVTLSFIKAWEFGYPGDCVVEMHDKLGPIFRNRLMGVDLLYTTESSHIKEILATRFEHWEKGEGLRVCFQSFLGNGVFNSDGEMWKFHRSMARPFFNKQRISDFDIFDHHTSEAISIIKERSGLVEIQDLLGRLALDAAAEFIFGSKMNTLSQELPYPHNDPRSALRTLGEGDLFAQAFARAEETVSLRTWRGPLWPCSEITKDATRDDMRVIDAFIEPILQQATENRRAKEGAEESNTLLDQLLSVTEDHVLLKDEILNILLAGRETTATTLTFLLYFLSLHPEILAKLRSEILDKVSGRRPTYEDITVMKFLRACINETLRLMPPVPVNIRCATQDTTLSPVEPGGKPFFVPAKTYLAYYPFLTHRRKDLWGPDADEFDPDRFIDDRVQKYQIPNPYIFVPFNAGPRICLGQQFAYNEISFVMVRLLQQFSSLSLVPEAFDPKTLPPKEWASCTGRKGVEKVVLGYHLTLYSKSGMWMRLEEAGQ